jgi:hypothetical protein
LRNYLPVVIYLSQIGSVLRPIVLEQDVRVDPDSSN